MNEMPKSTPTVDDVDRLAVAAREALTDQMIERLAITGGNALEVIDRLNDENTSAAVHRLIDRLTEMQKAGSLDTACDMIMLLHAMRNALTDAMVERLLSYAEYMVTSVANEDVCDLVTNACQAMNEAAVEICQGSGAWWVDGNDFLAVQAGDAAQPAISDQLRGKAATQPMRRPLSGQFPASSLNLHFSVGCFFEAY